MTKYQAQQAIELIGGLNATARLVLNAGGNPIARQNLSKALSNPTGVPEWLAEQLYNLVCRHAEACEKWTMETADER